MYNCGMKTSFKKHLNNVLIKRLLRIQSERHKNRFINFFSKCGRRERKKQTVTDFLVQSLN